MNFYDILEIKYTASDEEIKKAYRKLVLKYHPDKNNGSDKKFKEIKSAYDVLSIPHKRREYDQKYIKKSRKLSFHERHPHLTRQQADDLEKELYGVAQSNFSKKSTKDTSKEVHRNSINDWIKDAPEPKRDLWGDAILPEDKFVDSVNYEDKSGDIWLR